MSVEELLSEVRQTNRLLRSVLEALQSILSLIHI